MRNNTASVTFFGQTTCEHFERFYAEIPVLRIIYKQSTFEMLQPTAGGKDLQKILLDLCMKNATVNYCMFSILHLKKTYRGSLSFCFSFNL
jgi:hypothetical protein